MKLSIVTSLYCSGDHLKTFCERITKTAEKITNNYELILVNDGSPDESLKIALELKNQYHQIKVLDLSRNFGQHKALMTGISHASGDYIFIIDCDLEEEPELLTLFWEKIKQNNNADVLYGIQRKRKGGWYESLSGYLFYKFFNFLSYIKIPNNLATIRLMKRSYVDALLKFKESELFLGGLFSATGFTQFPVEIDKKNLSKSTYHNKNKIQLFINSITSFSSDPLILIFYMGLIVTLSSFMGILFILYQK